MKKLISSFIRYIQTEKGYSAHTIRNYASDLRQFTRFVATKRGVKKADLGIDLVDHMLIRSIERTCPFKSGGRDNHSKTRKPYTYVSPYR
jgi:site-specific recombinase XerD